MGYFGPVGDVRISSAIGSVTENQSVGGLVGYNRGKVSMSYFAGEITGEEDVGVIIGYDERGSVSNSFWKVEVSGTNISD